jgi:hypothetical protein
MSIDVDAVGMADAALCKIPGGKPLCSGRPGVLILSQAYSRQRCEKSSARCLMPRRSCKRAQVMGMTKQRPPGDVKPGWTTSEFWQTLLVHGIAAIVALGTVFHTHFKLNGLQAIVPAVALIASAVAQAVYSQSRATVKSSAQAAGAQARSASAVTGHGLAGAAEPMPIVVRLTGVSPSFGAGGEETGRLP